MSRRLDLNERRQARMAEANAEPLTVVLGEEEFTLPAELPLAFAFYMQNLDMDKAAASLVGKSDADRFLAANPSMQDMEAIVEEYGIDMGESSASPRSLTSTGKRSRPTSRGSTAKTSAK